MKASIRKMTEQDLEQVLTWRNHPEVRRFMFSRYEIALDEHKAWFEEVSQEKNRYLLVFEQNNQARGFVNLVVSAGGIVEWGFYTDPAAPKGTGMALGRQLLAYTFGELSMHKLVGQVLDFNERSKKFHLRLGFQQEGILRQQHFDGDRYHDVISYGLLVNEWQKR